LMYCKKKTIVGAIRRSADPVNAYVKATSMKESTQSRFILLSFLSIFSAHVRLRFAFPLDWTRVSCRKYGYESDFGSPVQAQLLALR
jgi:hypothetical protein